jgi:predicted GNAT family acetyltransferase
MLKPSMERADLVIRDNPEARRYEALLGNEVVGFVRYHLRPGLLTALDTEVDPGFEGLGVGSALVAGMLDDLRARGISVQPFCPFVRTYIRRHPDYADLLGAA